MKKKMLAAGLLAALAAGQNVEAKSLEDVVMYPRQSRGLEFVNRSKRWV